MCILLVTTSTVIFILTHIVWFCLNEWNEVESRGVSDGYEVAWCG